MGLERRQLLSRKLFKRIHIECPARSKRFGRAGHSCVFRCRQRKHGREAGRSGQERPPEILHKIKEEKMENDPIYTFLRK